MHLPQCRRERGCENDPQQEDSKSARNYFDRHRLRVSVDCHGRSGDRLRARHHLTQGGLLTVIFSFTTLGIGLSSFLGLATQSETIFLLGIVFTILIIIGWFTIVKAGQFSKRAERIAMRDDPFSGTFFSTDHLDRSESR